MVFYQENTQLLQIWATYKKWIEIFYKNIKSCVVVNGQVSIWFQIERGCRQGDPLSLYIYLLCAEILAIRISQSSSVTGIKIKDVEYLISQFADDTSVYLDGSRESFENVIKILTEFALWSGLKINYDKSQVVLLGSQKGSGTVFLPHLKLKWNPTRFSVLGIIYSTDLEKIMDLNYNSKIEQIQILLKNWQGRSLTPLGKITVIKSLMLSRITHLFFCLCRTRVIDLLKI